MTRFHRLLLITALAAPAVLHGIAQTPAQNPAQPPASPPAAGTADQQAPAGPQRGGGFGRAQTNETTDFTPKPPYVARGPEEEARGFMLPAGYRMELVAADPDVISPGGHRVRRQRPHVRRELISYMMDADATREHEPISRISRWESTKGDGVYDKHTVFVDKRRGAAHDPAAAGRRDPHQRDRLRRHREVDRHQRRRRRRQARGGVHRHRPERRRQHRAPEGGPPLEHGQLDLHDLQPVPHPLDADRLPARADRRRTAASGASRRTTTASRGSWMRAASAAR